MGGVPAKFIRWRFEETLLNRILARPWWHYDLRNIVLDWSAPERALDALDQMIDLGQVALYQPVRLQLKA